MLSSVGGFLAWIAGIVVLVKLFQNGGLVKGLIGLVTCNIYTFIWGWMNIGKEELKLKTWMYIWTACAVLGVILTLVGAMSGAGGE